MSNVLNEVETDRLLALLLGGLYADGDAAFLRRNSDVLNPPQLSAEWEDAIERNWNEIRVHNSHKRGLKKGIDIRVLSLPQILRLCRLNANLNGNLVDEVTGAELTPSSMSFDRVINEIIQGVSGEYSDEQILIVHTKINDWKESGGRKIFKDVETLEMEKARLNITEQDHRLSTILILRHYLDPIRAFRASQPFRDNMARLEAAK